MRIIEFVFLNFLTNQLARDFIHFSPKFGKIMNANKSLIVIIGAFLHTDHKMVCPYFFYTYYLTE